MIQGFTATPLPCKIDIKPRSPQIADVINKLFLDSTPFLEPFELELSDEDHKYNKLCRC